MCETDCETGRKDAHTERERECKCIGKDTERLCLKERDRESELERKQEGVKERDRE